LCDLNGLPCPFFGVIRDIVSDLSIDLQALRLSENFMLLKLLFSSRAVAIPGDEFFGVSS
jgi:hypothetical protein